MLPWQMLVLQLACVAALAVGVAARLVGWDRPLWLDEAFTGAIALRPKLSMVVEDSLGDVAGPLNYAVTWAWVKAFGASNASLRTPSLIFSLVAPLLVLWRGDPDRVVRYVWAALLAVVYMIGFFSHEARAYSLLMLLGLVQLLMFRSLINHPTAACAWGWVAVSVLFVMAHAYTLPVTGLQWLMLVAFRGRALARYWPAMLLFLLPIGWMILQLPVFVRAAAPGMAWQTPVDLAAIFVLEHEVFGHFRGLSWLIRIMIVAMVATFGWDVVQALRRRQPLPYRLADVLAVATAVAALALLLALGALRPSFTPRYILHLLPALLLSLALWSRRMTLRLPLLPVAVIAVFTAMGAVMALKTMRDPMLYRFPLDWQDAAETMMAENVQHVAFFWDDRVAPVPAQSLLARTGGFFFDRAGSGIRTDAIVLAQRTDDPDPTIVLTQYLDSTRTNRERDGFIWLVTPSDRAIWWKHPARLDELSKQFECHDYSADARTIALACIRRINATPSAP